MKSIKLYCQREVIFKLPKGNNKKKKENKKQKIKKLKG